jgi:hypothetical protein
LYRFDIKVMPGTRKKKLGLAIKEMVLASSGKGWGKGNTQPCERSARTSR